MYQYYLTFLALSLIPFSTSKIVKLSWTVYSTMEASVHILYNVSIQWNLILLKIFFWYCYVVSDFWRLAKKNCVLLWNSIQLPFFF